MVNLRHVEDLMVSELKITKDEAKIYMLILSKGKMDEMKIAGEIGLDRGSVGNAVKGLIDKGTLIEMNGKYEALNPRFAITNMYRVMCYASHQEVRRNKTVDQLATLLEKPYEDARTK